MIFLYPLVIFCDCKVSIESDLVGNLDGDFVHDADKMRQLSDNMRLVICNALIALDIAAKVFEKDVKGTLLQTLKYSNAYIRNAKFHTL